MTLGHLDSTDIVGWTDGEGGLVCPDCHTEGALIGVKDNVPIFADAEFDYQAVCDLCGEPLEIVRIDLNQ